MGELQWGTGPPDAGVEMAARIRNALEYCPNLPTPPAIALKVLELGRDPDVDLAALANVLAKDPALSSRILRASNSALYAQRRRSENLRQAMVVMGLNATMTLALSFTLPAAMVAGQRVNTGLQRIWRRGLITASAARLIGERLSMREVEELFLAGLLQDIGVLALDAAVPDIFGPLLKKARSHQELLLAERATLGTDHGESGSWLMRRWNLPERLAAVPAAVHQPDAADIAPELRDFVRCVAVASRVADLLLSEDQGPATVRAAESALEPLAIPADAIPDLLDQVAGMLPELSALYDTEILSAGQVQGVLDNTQEVLATRTLRLIQRVEEHQRRVFELEQTNQHLMRAASTDTLTGLQNRQRFEATLDNEFRVATENGWPLTVGFIDLDNLKEINDKSGHLTGDAALARIADLLSRNLRQRDFLMRYGGDEFIALLPGTGLAHALPVFERLRAAIADEAHHDDTGRRFRTTVSVGLASHMDAGNRASSPTELIRCADMALYEAKGGGRNRVVIRKNGCR